MSLPLTKLQHDVCSEIVGGIFLMTKYWHIENIERCMSGLMQGNPEKLSNCRIGWRYAVGITFIGKDSNMRFKNS
jgi:hypothetical protein